VREREILLKSKLRPICEIGGTCGSNFGIQVKTANLAKIGRHPGQTEWLDYVEVPEGTSIPLPISNHHRGASEYDNSAVCGLIAHARGEQITDQDRGGTFYNYVRRSDTGAHIGNPGSGLSSDEDGRASGGQNRATHMRHRRYTGRDHRASMHIAYSSCRRHNISLADC
jgi:hypothetical protein